LFLSAAQGSFAHAGQAATFEHGGAGPTSITINVGSGSFTATGQPAGMAEGGGAPAITVAVGQGSFVATGQPAGMAEGGGAPAITVAVGQGSFVATGQPAGLLEGGGIPPITVAVGTGSFVASGYEVGLSEAAPAGYLLTAGTGAFVRTGYAANLLRQRTLAASSRAFAVTGQATTLRRGRFITATRGTFTVSGSATGFKGERRLTAIAGAFLITGFAPNTKRNRIACATGFFSITGGRVDLDYDRTRSINIPVLNTTGFQIVEISDRWRLHTADFGDGYMSALTVGHPEGRRSWRVRIEALPGAAGFGYLRDDNPGFVLTEDQGHALTEGDGRIILDVATTRAQYLWNFFRNSKSKGDQPFWFEVEDPATGNRFDYVANFAADQLSYEVLCAQVYATGLELVERRLPPQNF
jgi:hypothetical protein